MPNRILKESICVSDQINQLSWFEEILFYRLMVNVDDYGRYDGRPAIIRSRLFPLKDVRDKQIEDALGVLSSVELVEVYSVDGKPFVRLTGWDKHQTIRAKKSKYPAPDGGCENMKTFASRCKQMQADVHVIQSNPNPNPPYNPPTGGIGGGEDELLAISEKNNRVFDKAQACGFVLNTATLDRLTDLIANHGADSVFSALDECVKAQASNFRYLEKVLENKKAESKTKAVSYETFF